MHPYEPEYLFGQWAENSLTEDEQRAFEQLCRDNADFAARIAQFESLEALANQYTDAEVPQWHPESTLVPQVGSLQSKEKTGRWWQSALSLTSLAASFAAVLMVTTNLRIEMNNDGVFIGTANSYTDKEIQTLVNSALEKHQQGQREQLQLYAQELRQQQQQFSEQLSSYVLSANRQERKQDFAELIKYVNEQRSDDQVYFARQINQIQDDLDTRLPAVPWQAEPK